MNQENLGTFLVTLRKEKGLTQKEVAKYIGVTEQAISKWERGIGIPDVSLWKGIVDVYDISLVEFLQCERLKKEEKKAEGMLQETLERTNYKINKMKSKEVVLLIILSLSIFILSLFLKIKWVNALLFLGASLIVIYFLGVIFKKLNYPIRFVIITFIVLAIILGYSYLEKLSILSGYREPIFSIKEIYKEYQVTVYDSFFYDAYSCDYTSNEIAILDEFGIEKVCASNNGDVSEDNIIVLKSGAEITKEQKQVLQDNPDILSKLGFVDYNYMRDTDLQEFWNYMDENRYCYSKTDDTSNVVIKRKNGVCQYDNQEYYYCKIVSEDGTFTYTKAENGACN